MKRLLAISFALLLLGCTDERSKVIADYIQSQSNVKNDLSFSLIRIVNLDNLSAGDSLLILKADYDRKKEKFSKEYNDLMLASLSLKNSQKERSWIQASISDNQARINDYTKQIDTVKSVAVLRINELEERAEKGNAAALIHKQKQLLELRDIGDLIVKYRADPDVILARTAKVTYSITYPEANDKIKEVTKTFVFSEDNKRVLDVIR